VGDLKPGETKRLGEVRHPGSAGGYGWEQRESLRRLLVRAQDNAPAGSFPGAILLAETTGAPLGPPLGRYVGSDNSISVLVSLPLTGEGR
jgi:hypothetical protein